MNGEKKPEQLRIKPKKEEKKPVNRKVLLGLFVATGLVSLFFWWRGNVIRETYPEEKVKEEMKSDDQAEGQPAEVNDGRLWQLKEQRLIEELKEMTATASGRYAVYVYRIDDKSSYGFGENERMPAASIMKVPVMMAAWREIAAGRLKETDIYTLDEADRSTGSGPLQFKPAGSEYTVEELLTYLGKNSDNTAWVMFNRRLGKTPIKEIMTEAGMNDSLYDDGVITAVDAAKMWEFVYNGRAGGDRSREAIFGYLTDSIYEDRIPAGVAGAGCEIIAHKVGTDAGVWTDAGIMGLKYGDVNPKRTDIIVVILNQEVTRAEANLMVPEIAGKICEFEENRLETR